MKLAQHGGRDTRRSLLKRLVVARAGAYLSAAMPHRRAFAGVSYVGLSSDDFLGEVETLAQVKDDKIFTEGPAVDAQGCVYFTNVAMSKILRFDSENGELSVFRENSNQTNGMYFDPQGRLLCCEGETGRVTRTDMKSGKIEVLAGRFRDKPLAAPNDLCIDAKGNLYVAAGLHALRKTSETLDTKPGIHVISPEGRLLAFRETLEDTITNCTFGGSDLCSLYITCGTLLLRIRTRIPGKASYHPQG